jgi:hypothetical protein
LLLTSYGIAVLYSSKTIAFRITLRAAGGFKGTGTVPAMTIHFLPLRFSSFALLEELYLVGLVRLLSVF